MEERLTSLQPRREDDERRYRVRLSTEASLLRVRMEDAGGNLVGERTLPSEGSCDARAELVAVVLAAWEEELPTRVATLPEPRPVAVAVSATEGPPPSLQAAVGVGGSLAPESIALGAWTATVEGSLGTRAQGWGGLLAFAGSSGRRVTLGAGEIDWLRLSAGVGPRYRLPVKRQRFDFSAELDGAALSLQGVGYATNYRPAGFNLGAGVGVACVFTQTALSPWLKLAGRQWFGTQQAQVNGVEGMASIPGFEAALTVGMAWSQL